MDHSNNLKIEKFFTPTGIQNSLIRASLTTNNKDGIYIEQLLITIRGKLHEETFQTAWRKLIKRHENLRSVFIWNQFDEIKQVVLKNIQLNLTQYDFSNHPNSEIDQLILDYTNEDALKGFKLNKPPLFRIIIFKINKNLFKILYSFHHAIIDGWSLGVIFYELSYIYHCLLHQSPISLSQTTGYERFVNWIKKQQNHSQLIQFWKKKLNNIEATNLPKSLHSTDLSKNKFQSIHYQFETSLVKNIDQYCKTNYLTLNSLISGVWALILYFYLNQRSITYGCVYAIRPDEIENISGMVGPLINTIPITISFEKNSTILNYFQSIQLLLAEYQENSQLILEKIIDIYSSLNKEKNLTIDQTSLFECMIAFEKFSETHLDTNQELLAKKEFNYEKIFIQEIKVFEKINLPLALVCYPGTHTLELKLLFHNDKIDQYYANNIMNHFLAITKILIFDSEQNDLITSIKEKLNSHQSILIGKKIASTKNLNDYLYENSMNFPDYLALVEQDKQMTYKNFVHLVKQIESNLPIEKGEIVGVHLSRNISTFALIYAIFAKQGCYLPLDKQLPIERINFIVKDAGAKLVITDSTTTVNQFDITSITFDALLTSNHTSIFFHLNHPHQKTNAAYIIYTSGSTGQPKGVMVSYVGLSNLCIFCADLIQKKNMNFLQFSALNFDASILEMCIAATSGSSLFIIQEDIKTNVEKIEEFINTQKITHAFLPTALAAYLDKEKLPYFNTLLVGGELCPSKLAEIWSQDRNFFNLYGPTEVSSISTFNPVNNTQDFTAIGIPGPNITLKILDENNIIVPKGVVGELFIEGPSVGLGYINQPDLTKKYFVAGGYKTGDLCYQNNKNLIVFVGRKDEQIKINGQRIELAEIEKQLTSIPEIQEAIVLPFKNTPNNHIVLHAFIRHNHLSRNLNEYLINMLRLYLPVYMIPRNYHTVEKWPLTMNNKIDKFKLKNQITSYYHNEQYEACSSATELIICQFFTEVLNSPQIKLTKQDDFFFLGGNSILATTLILKLSKHFKLNIPINIIYSHSQIATLANYIDNCLINKKQEDHLLNLNKEAELEKNLIQLIKPQKMQSIIQAKNILLTGATGFVGRYLLRELLDNTSANIICLVRAQNDVAAKNRVLHSLIESSLLKEKDLERITAFSSDLFKLDVGLKKDQYEIIAKMTDSIMHCAANVNLAESYSSLAEDNKIAINNIIKLATTFKIKPINYISTVSIIHSYGLQKGIVKEHEAIPYQSLDGSGYTLTKWVAEKMLLNAKELYLPVNIYRLPRIWGDSLTGYSNEKDALLIIIWTLILIESIPKNWMLVKNNLNLMPVDYLAKIIIKISSIETNDWGKIYHMQYPYNISMKDLIHYLRTLGYQINEEEPEIWLDKIQKIVTDPQGNTMIKSAFGILSTFSHQQANVLRDFIIDCSHTHQIIKTTQIKAEPFIPNLLNLYLQYLINKHHFPLVKKH